MTLQGSTIPKTKRFFKISELAGKRWPNVTEDEIYEWHDAKIYPTPIPGSGPGVYEAMCDFLSDDVGLETNLFRFWVFFSEFRALWQNQDARRKQFGAHQHLFPYNLFTNVYLSPSSKETLGFAHNREGKVKCMLFWDEQGEFHIPVLFEQGEHKNFPGHLEIHKDDLLLKASTVSLMEQIAPELTIADRNPKDVSVFLDNSKAPPIATEEYAPASAGIPLEGWKAIAGHVGVSVSTARRKYKDAIKHTPAGKPFITTAALDQFRIKTANKLNKRKKG